MLKDEFVAIYLVRPFFFILCYCCTQRGVRNIHGAARSATTSTGSDRTYCRAISLLTRRDYSACPSTSTDVVCTTPCGRNVPLDRRATWHCCVDYFVISLDSFVFCDKLGA